MLASRNHSLNLITLPWAKNPTHLDSVQLNDPLNAD